MNDTSNHPLHGRVRSRQVDLVGPGELVERVHELDPLIAGWARVRFLFGAICGSDMSKFEGRRALDYPESLGHEFVGRVVALGKNSTDLRVGDVVTSDLNHRCGRCDLCRRNRSHLCVEAQRGMFSNRAFAEYGDLDARYLYRVDAAPAAHLALAEPLSCALHAVSWARPRSGDRVLVVGAGGIGLCTSFALSTSSWPCSFDVIDRLTRRTELVADAAGSSARPVTSIDGSYDVVLDVSGTVDGLRLACRSTKRGGRLCSMSHLDGYGDTAFLLPALTRQDIEFKVSYLNGEPANLRAAVQLLTTRWDAGWDQTLRRVPLESVEAAFRGRRTSDRCKTVVEIS